MASNSHFIPLQIVILLFIPKFLFSSLHDARVYRNCSAINCLLAFFAFQKEFISIYSRRITFTESFSPPQFCTSFFFCAALNEHEYEYKTNPALRFWPRLWLLWLFSFLYRMTNVFLMKSVSTIYWILLCIWCWSEIEHIPNDSKWRSIFQVIF